MFKRYSLIFVVAFVLNLIWENLHSFLYLNYQGGPITELNLLRATLFDAVFITLLFLLTDSLKLKNRGLYIQIGLSFLVTVLIEVFALATTRWVYGLYMPIIPFLEVGFTPILQLPLLTWLTGRLVLTSSQRKI